MCLCLILNQQTPSHLVILCLGFCSSSFPFAKRKVPHGAIIQPFPTLCFIFHTHNSLLLFTDFLIAQFLMASLFPFIGSDTHWALPSYSIRGCGPTCGLHHRKFLPSSCETTHGATELATTHKEPYNSKRNLQKPKRDAFFTFHVF